MQPKETSKARKYIARVLLVVSLPIVFLGLIDPLEGGIALLLAAALLSGGFFAAGYLPSKALWIPFVLAIVVGIITLLFAIFGMDRANNQPSMFPLVALMWLYRVIVVVTLVGLLREVIRIFRTSTFRDMNSRS